MDNKNTIVAVVLMLAVWIGFSFLFPPQQPTQPPAPAAPARSPAPAAEAPKPPPASSVQIPAQATQVRQIVVENDLFRAVLSTSGARIVSLDLKRFSVTPEGKEQITLVKAEVPRNGTLRTAGTDGIPLPADAVYSLEGPGQISLSGNQSRELVFTAPLPNGLVAEKIFVFHGDKYQVDFRVRLRNGGSQPAQGALQVALVQPWDDKMKGSQFEFVGPSILAADEVDNVKVKDLEEKPLTYGGDVVWTSFVDMYFMRALVPLEGAAAKSQIERDGSLVVNSLFTPVRTLAPGESASFSYLAYFGPKDLDILKAVDHRLAEAIDYGIFSFLAKPLLHVLKLFYSFLGNYGLAIILLTVIIKLLFWPLTQKSYASMKAMQKLQPQMQKIREKHKNDRDRLNREIMELYRNNRVNPLGGCLPMLVQIPVFFALYKVLLNSIELRHAPFYLWIQDLSAKDPYYITPLVMGATMFIQQKMTPTTMDPVQAKVFMLMPIIFTFMFLNFPSGLVIYWLINNVLTIGQQFLINRKAD